MRNLHKFYYKDYFAPDRLSWNKDDLKTNENNVKVIKGNNQKLCNPISKYHNPIDKNPLVNGVLSMRIQYPGLVTGIGINHEIGVEGEYKLGMHFDWTYGVPVVYGSSVKGVLRAWFQAFFMKSKPDVDPSEFETEIFKGKLRDIKAEKEKYGQEWDKMVKEVENRIYSSKSIYDRDVFFDAVVVATDSQKRILCSDSITPHNENPLKNPKPLTFMKVAPGCELEFRFKLHDTEINGVKLSKEDKLNLFKDILTTVGIGAKTNVGYGQLSEKLSEDVST